MEAPKHLQQNPWITFVHPAHFEPLSVLLGEAFSKCEHLMNSALPPTTASRLAQVFLVRGALASTAIEGNTLTEEQAGAAIAGRGTATPSTEYLDQEVRNIAHAIEAIDRDVQSGVPFFVTPEWIREQNRRVLEGLETEPHVVPGEYTTTQVVVGPYRAAPPEDVPVLIEQLCAWLEKDWLEPALRPETPPAQKFALIFHAAVLGHLYIAWIHPFGDGNGRTARLLECAILGHSEVVPWLSANVLSDHYNRTRTQYYRRLQAASEQRDVAGFVLYSAQGFVDRLREQLAEVHGWVRFATWTHYVYMVLHNEPPGKATERHRDIALALAGRGRGPILKSEIRLLAPALASAYAAKQDKTVSRDLAKLLRLGLVKQVGRGRSARYTSGIDILDAYHPSPPQRDDAEVVPAVPRARGAGAGRG